MLLAVSVFRRINVFVTSRVVGWAVCESCSAVKSLVWNSRALSNQLLQSIDASWQTTELIDVTTMLVDRRRGWCYVRVPRRPVSADADDRVAPCTMPVGETLSHSTCCCTVGRGWTETATAEATCLLCPRNGTRQYCHNWSIDWLIE